MNDDRIDRDIALKALITAVTYLESLHRQLKGYDHGVLRQSSVQINQFILKTLSEDRLEMGGMA